MTERVIVGAVAYPDLRDHSAGLVVVERLMTRELPFGVHVEDLSFNPIAVMQRLEAEPADDPFALAIFVSSVPRERGRLPGTITAYRWDGRLPDPTEIQRAVADAVTGIIHVDNTVIVAGHFGALPAHVYLIEIEPLVHDFGDALSDPVAAAIEPACSLVLRLAADPAARRSLPTTPLGGGSLPSAIAR